MSTFISSNVTSTTSFTDDFIVAGGTTLASSGDSVKYYYVLLEIDDVTLPVNFTPTFNWTVTCSEYITSPIVTIHFTGPGTSSLFTQNGWAKVAHIQSTTEYEDGMAFSSISSAEGGHSYSNDFTILTGQNMYIGVISYDYPVVKTSTIRYNDKNGDIIGSIRSSGNNSIRILSVTSDLTIYFGSWEEAIG